MTLHLDEVTVDVGVPAERAVSAVSLTLEDGQVLAVVGPSGSGKSTLLRAIAGLEPLTSGRIRWDSEDLAPVPTHRRGFALMFQDGQLFDHLSVVRNVAYPLRLRGRGRREATSAAGDLLDLVGLQGYADRLPRTLSGGERQRVALARALAARPRLLLLDEPLSALDAGLRTRLAADLRRILTEAGTTALLVTHDQDEAYAVADRLAVMRDTYVVQEGAVADVWAHPVDADTALFLGYAQILDGPAAQRLAALAGMDGKPARLAVRRSAVRVVPTADAPAIGVVTTVAATPDEVRLTLGLEGVGELDATARSGARPAVGDRVGLRVDPAGLAIVTDP